MGKPQSLTPYFLQKARASSELIFQHAVMSLTLLKFAKSFLSERLTAEVFSEAYIELWRIERDSDILLRDPPALSECLSSIFCAADMYYPAESREEHQFDEGRLRAEVARWVQMV